MPKEIEVKFLNINLDEIQGRLKAAGATLKTPMRLMRRITAKTDKMRQEEAFVRLRDEGDKITLTYKRFEKKAIDGCYEIEIKIDCFEKGVAFLNCLNFTSITRQESKRETWILDGAEIVLDIWPWIHPYLEIEGNHETQLRQVALKLGLNWENACFGSTMTAYEAEYPDIIGTDFVLADLENVSFESPCPIELGNRI